MRAPALTGRKRRGTKDPLLARLKGGDNSLKQWEVWRQGDRKGVKTYPPPAFPLNCIDHHVLDEQLLDANRVPELLSSESAHLDGSGSSGIDMDQGTDGSGILFYQFLRRPVGPPVARYGQLQYRPAA